VTDWPSDRAGAKVVRCFSIVGVIFALAIMIAASAGAQPMVRPYALHDIRLGASLSEIRELQFLDVEGRQKLRLICSTDADSAGIDLLHPLATVLRPNEVRCALYERVHADLPPVAGAMQIFGEMVQPYFLFYPERPGGEPHLGQIVTRMKNDRFQAIVAIMRRAYGPTSDYQMSSFRTVYGDMLNATYYWRNGVSSIEATFRSLELDKMSVILTLNGLAG
jgi:hypothetical protein